MLNCSLGSLLTAIQSIVYGVAAGGLLSLIPSAGATMVLPLVRAILTSTATTGVRMILMKAGEAVVTDGVLSNLFARGHRPDGADDNGNDDSGPPSYHQTVPQEYLLTPPAVKAIVKSWDVPPYNPPVTVVVGWSTKVRSLCELYRVPVTQRTMCAMHNMSGDCWEAASAAGCYDMTWDQFTTWLFKYDAVCYLKIPSLVLGADMSTR